MSKLTIRALTSADQTKALALVNFTYGLDMDQFFIPDFNRAVSESRSRILGAFLGEKLVGLAGFVCSSICSKTCELNWLTVVPAAQLQGIGRELSQARLAEAKSLKYFHAITITKPSSRYGSNAIWTEIPGRGKSLLLLNL